MFFSVLDSFPSFGLCLYLLIVGAVRSVFFQKVSPKWCPPKRPKTEKNSANRFLNRTALFFFLGFFSRAKIVREQQVFSLGFSHLFFFSVFCCPIRFLFEKTEKFGVCVEKMGGCQAKDTTISDEEIARNKAIDKIIRQDMTNQQKEIKLLLLGAGQSGKSTLAKQMKVLYLSGFTSDERSAYKEIVFSNIHTNVIHLINGARLNGLELSPQTMVRSLLSFFFFSAFFHFSRMFFFIYFLFIF